MSDELKCRARDLFGQTLQAIDVERVVRAELKLVASQLHVGDAVLDLDDFRRVTLIALGKAAEGLARAAKSVLGKRVSRGLVVTHSKVEDLGAEFEWIEAGHPVPDAGSVRAAQRALELVGEADSEDDLVLFLISGGASAMLESPLDPRVSLDDLRAAHQTLVTCGAVIGEMNIVRRRMSSVKGGRLAAAAPKATQITLLVSDVNAGDLATIASGPTLPDLSTQADLDAVISRYGLRERLSAPILKMLDRERGRLEMPEHHIVHLLMSDRQAVAAASDFAGACCDVVESEFWDELPVSVLAERIVARLKSMMEANPGQSVCFLSAGESICPVRGDGRGGRNQELALRVAVLLSAFGEVAFLAAGTDGIDGNSPAAGAVVDERTVARAEAMGLEVESCLQRSDSFRLLDAIAATVVTGPTGGNVRDLWIAMAR